MTEAFRARYPGPWKIEATPRGFRIYRGATTLCWLYTYTADWQSIATTGRHMLTQAEGLALAK